MAVVGVATSGNERDKMREKALSCASIVTTAAEILLLYFRSYRQGGIYEKKDNRRYKTFIAAPPCRHAGQKRRSYPVGKECEFILLYW